MKQLIVLVATIILGISIGGIVLGFNDTAQDLGNSAIGGLNSIGEVMSKAAIDVQSKLP